MFGRKRGRWGARFEGLGCGGVGCFRVDVQGRGETCEFEGGESERERLDLASGRRENVAVAWAFDGVYC